MKNRNIIRRNIFFFLVVVIQLLSITSIQAKDSFKTREITLEGFNEALKNKIPYDQPSLISITNLDQVIKKILGA